MFPVSAETTVSASEQAHLPRNMFSIPQAERCTARPRRRPPTEQTAEPRNTGSRQRVRTEGHRHTAGGAVGRDSGGCSRQASLHSDRQTISGLFFLSFFFYGSVIFHCIYVPQFLYPFISRWALRLLACPGYCK